MSDCSCSCGTQEAQSKFIPLDIEFLFLDRSVCDRCMGTEENLAEAITLTRPVLNALGYDPQLTESHISSIASALSHRFLSSPTIRIAGRDLMPEISESSCSSCSTLADDTAVSCRDWDWRGEKSTAAPVGFLVEAILSSVMPDRALDAKEDLDADYVIPENLIGFFKGLGDEKTRSCCG